VQHPTKRRLPTIAFARPPPSDPGAGVLFINKERSRAENPLINKILRIHNKKIIPMTIAPIDRVRPILLERLRFAKIA
jgi:hypothetical protein